MSSSFSAKQSKFRFWKKRNDGSSSSNLRSLSRSSLSNSSLGESLHSISSHFREENDSTNPPPNTSFQNCLTIDDALCNLYHPTLPIDMLNELNTSSRHENILNRIPSYDWLLDGYDSDPDNGDENNENTGERNGQTPQRKQFETFNEEEKVMNNLLNRMELESTPLKTTFTKSNLVDNDSDEEQEWGDFVSAHDEQNEPQPNPEDFENDIHNIHAQGIQMESNENTLQKVDDQNQNSIIKIQHYNNSFDENSTTVNQDNSNCKNIIIEKDKENHSEIEMSQTEKSCEGSEQFSFPNLSSSGNDDDIAPLSSSSFLILNKLAIPSMESLEGRFIRRIMLDENKFDEDEDECDEFQNDDEHDDSSTTDEWWQKTEKRMEMDLSPEYYTEDFDPIPNLFENFPIEDELVEEYLTQKLSEMDVIHKRIDERMVRKMQANFDFIADGMERALDIDGDVVKAHMFTSKARNHLKRARLGSQIDSSFEITKLIKCRENLQFLLDLSTSCDNLIKEEKELLLGERGKENFHEVIERACDLRIHVVQNPIFKELLCLTNLRERSEKVMTGLKQRIEGEWLGSFLKDCCCFVNEFRSHEYQQILSARFILEPHLKQECGDLEPADVVESISTGILSTLLIEASRAFANALLPFLPSNFNIDMLRQQIEQCTNEDKYALEKLIVETLEQVDIDFTIFESLCISFLDILLVHHQIVKWHEDCLDHHNTREENMELKSIQAIRTPETLTERERVRLIGENLASLKNILWIECSKHILSLLQHFSIRYKRKQKWYYDLIPLKNSLNILDSFLTINKLSCGTEFVEQGLSEKFLEVLKKYLRTIHVQAMNELGEMLSNETWNIEEVAIEERGMKKELQSMLQEHIHYSFDQSYEGDTELQSYFKKFNIPNPSKRFTCFMTPRVNRTPINATEVAEATVNLYSQIEVMIEDSSVLIATKTALQGVCKWIGRLLVIYNKLPILASDLTLVFRNIYDLYMLTSFRLCVGNSANERIILQENHGDEDFGISSHSDTSALNSGSSRNSKRFFSPTRDRRKSRKNRITEIDLVLISTIEAKICSSLLSESNDILYLLQFIEEGRASLNGIVNFDKVENWISVSPDVEVAANVLEKRVAAAKSCIFLAALLEAAISMIKDIDRCWKNDFNSDETAEIDSLHLYNQNVLRITPILVSKSILMAATQVVKGKEAVLEILKIGAVWEETRLNEYYNPYVDDLCDRLASIWFFLSNSTQTRCILNSIWENMVVAGFLSLLEGFSRISSCSTEGRALMSMDLATFTSEVTSPRSVRNRVENIFGERIMNNNELQLSSPPVVTISRGMKYVDIYVKVFYFNKEDAMDWISENIEDYHISHCISLISSIIRKDPNFSKNDLNEAIEQIQLLYQNR